jgi:hypothetical protein
MHVFLYVSNYYIWPICCNFSVCVLHDSATLPVAWACVCTICLSFQCLGICIFSNANVCKLYYYYY